MTMTKKRLTFYRHLKSIGLNRLANKVMNYQEDRKIQIPWVNEMYRDIEEVGLAEEDERNQFRRKVPKVKDLMAKKTERKKDSHVGREKTETKSEDEGVLAEKKLRSRKGNPQQAETNKKKLQNKQKFPHELLDIYYKEI